MVLRRPDCNCSCVGSICPGAESSLARSIKCRRLNVRPALRYGGMPRLARYRPGIVHHDRDCLRATRPKESSVVARDGPCLSPRKSSKNSNPVSRLAVHPCRAIELAWGTESTEESLAPVQHSWLRNNNADLAGVSNPNVSSSLPASLSSGGRGLAWPGASRRATVSRNPLSANRHLCVRPFCFCRPILDPFFQRGRIWNLCSRNLDRLSRPYRDRNSLQFPACSLCRADHSSSVPASGDRCRTNIEIWRTRTRRDNRYPRDPSPRRLRPNEIANRFPAPKGFYR